MLFNSIITVIRFGIKDHHICNYPNLIDQFSSIHGLSALFLYQGILKFASNVIDPKDAFFPDSTNFFLPSQN